MEKLYSQQKQDLELTVARILSFSFLLSSSSAKFRMKLKNVGKTTRSVRYNLYHIPYEYTVEMNIFKRLDLLNRVPVEL